MKQHTSPILYPNTFCAYISYQDTMFFSTYNINPGRKKIIKKCPRSGAAVLMVAETSASRGWASKERKSLHKVGQFFRRLLLKKQKNPQQPMTYSDVGGFLTTNPWMKNKIRTVKNGIIFRRYINSNHVWVATSILPKVESWCDFRFYFITSYEKKKTRNVCTVN